MGLETAAIIALSSAAVGVAGSAASFAQAGKQARLAREAKAAAQKYVEEAKRQASVNYMDELALAKEPYEIQQRALQQQGADIMQQAAEGETRGVGAAASRIMAAQIQAQEQQRAQMAADIQTLEMTKKQEDSRIAGTLAGISLEEASGAQMAARDAERARVAANQAGIQGLTSMAQAGLEAAVPLYPGGGGGGGGGGGPIGGKVAAGEGGLQSFRRGYEPGGRMARRDYRRQARLNMMNDDLSTRLSGVVMPGEEVGSDVWASF